MNASNRFDLGLKMTRREAIRRGMLGGLGLMTAGSLSSYSRGNGGGRAQGIVFDAGSPEEPGRGDGIAGVRVSNGRDVVLSDSRGRWELPVLDAPHTIFFVIQPSGWRVPVDSLQIPRFYYIHCPEGSTHLRYGGLKPTGSLPAEIAFGLHRCTEQEDFKWALLADPQCRNEQHLRYLSHRLPNQLREESAEFGIVQGDLVWDRLDLLEPTAEVLAMAEIPMWYVFGNHDIDFDAPDNIHAADSYKQVFGPTCYAFDHGPVHFIIINNVVWEGGDSTGNYRGEVDPVQMDFIRNDLKHLDPDQPIVLAMHIPLESVRSPNKRAFTGNRRELLQCFRGHNLIFATGGHRHINDHWYLGKDYGWEGSEPLYYFTNGAACGSWWRGTPDIDGIPHSIMHDGSPRGYTAGHFRKGRIELDYRATDAPADHQIQIVTDPVDGDFGLQTGNHFLANFFIGCEHARVRYRIRGQCDWISMNPSLENCPRYVAFAEGGGSGLGRREPSRHLWKGTLPEGLPEGHHQLEVAAMDRSGKVYHASQRINFKLT